MTVTSILYGEATEYTVDADVGAWDDTNLTNPGTEDILVNSVALPSTFEIESSGVLSGTSGSTASLASQIVTGFTNAGVTPNGASASVVGLTYVVNVVIQDTQLAALTAIDVETDSSGALVPTNNC
jgi:hypothetical protein